MLSQGRRVFKISVKSLIILDSVEVGLPKKVTNSSDGSPTYMCLTSTASSVFPGRLHKSVHLCFLWPSLSFSSSCSFSVLPSSYFRCWKSSGKGDLYCSFLSVHTFSLAYKLSRAFSILKNFFLQLCPPFWGNSLYHSKNFLMHSLFNQTLPLEPFLKLWFQMSQVIWWTFQDIQHRNSFICENSPIHEDWWRQTSLAFYERWRQSDLSFSLLECKYMI